VISISYLIIADRFDCVTFVETTYMKTDICKSGLSQSHESRGLSGDSSKTCNELLIVAKLCFQKMKKYPHRGFISKLSFATYTRLIFPSCSKCAELECCF